MSKENNTTTLLWGIIAGIYIGTFLVFVGLLCYKYAKGSSDTQTVIVKDRVQEESVAVLELDIRARKDLHPINPLIYGSNLTPKTEFEMDVAKFAKEVGVTIFRWPGDATEGYRWRIGKFDRNSRFDNAPLSKVENVRKFCKISGSKLQLQVNMETEEPEDAAAWVRYMNIELKERVEYWELGNESYGDWEVNYMSGKEMAAVVRRFSRAMKAVDPTIKVGPNFGGPNFPFYDEELIKYAADDIDYITYHWYPSHVNKTHPFDGRSHPLPEEMLANSLNVAYMKKRVEDMIEKYAPHRRGKIEITFNEWDGSWDGVATDLKVEYKGMMWALSNALFYADTLGQFALHQIPMAMNYSFQEVMFGLIRGWDKDAGWGGSRWDGVTIRPKAFALKLYANHFGDILVDSELKNVPTYYKKRDWRADSYEGVVPYVSAYVSRFSDEDKIAISIINKHVEKEFDLQLNFQDVDPVSVGYAWIIDGPEPAAQNDGSPGTVTIKEFQVQGIEKSFMIKLPKHSVMMLNIPLRRELVNK